MSVACASRKLRSPLKWHGGKSYLARRIIALMPEHRTYVEPFAGGLSVLLNKPPAPVEVASDLNDRLIEFWRYLQTNGDALREMLDGLPYGRESFDDADAAMESGDLDRRVAGFVARNRMSRGGLGRDFAWSDRLRGKTRPGGPIAGELNAWDTFREGLPATAERIRRVRFTEATATATIQAHDGPDALHYCDPPYLHETRSHRTAYAHEMTAEQHAELLDVLCQCKGAVMLSGYRSDLYDRRLTGWARHEFDMPNHAGQGPSKQRRREVVWMKPAG